MTRVHVLTLGCAKNEADSRAMAERLAAAGFSLEAEPDDADVLVINTCAFISDAAHQLRNPAAAILSLAESLPVATDPDERRQREQELITASRRSARLAEQLLSLERLRYGGAAATEHFDLNDVVHDACTDLAPEILERDIAFSFDGSPEPLPVSGDPTLIGEAIRNLIDNALRHGGRGLGKISVRARHLHDRAIVEVSDDGRGLSPDAADIAFRRFGQVEPGDGSGLGLSIVQSVATLHGGEVVVGDVPNGALLRLDIPLRGNCKDQAALSVDG